MPVPAGGTDEPVDLPGWAPTVQQVADYVPHRTLTRSVSSTTASQDAYQFSFDESTVPTGDVVQRLIADGVAWIASRLVPLNLASSSAARVAVTLYAAAAVERGWPDDDSSLQRATDMEKRLDAMLAALTASNTSANEADGVAAYPPPVMPVWNFPPADRRWDCNRYF